MEKTISNIVFTKNRPLQLEAYLESLYRHFPAELIQTYIIYKVELFDAHYEELLRKYSHCIVVREREFSGDFLKLLAQIDTKYILFGVDDVVYFDSVDLAVIDAVFDEYAGDIFGFSMRLSKDSLRDSGDAINEMTVRGETIYRLDWRNGRIPTTRYPFELCATIYRTSLVRKILCSSRKGSALLERLFAPGSPVVWTLGRVFSARSILKRFGYFFNPNTLESWNCRWCQNHGDQLPGCLFFQKQCASAIQVNMVNTSTDSITEGGAEHTVEALADKYREGYRLDIDFVSRNKPAGTHGGPEFFKLTKTGTCTAIE
ncbi:MAG: hypothetical protein AMJ75_08380 [Phycisphaerae bacterium SM1_79]|nr:MAG: hypothetical protein AMJ75_08380 [Phycisphaerae bacterium SM1_79]